LKGDEIIQKKNRRQNKNATHPTNSLPCEKKKKKKRKKATHKGKLSISDFVGLFIYLFIFWRIQITFCRLQLTFSSVFFSG
jgi:hypothetical protein